MTGIMARLERDGIVKRTKSLQDQRRIFISLTEAGQQCFVEMSAGMEANYLRIQQQFGEEKLKQLLQLLEDLKEIKP
jgi:DNA-binding MarR family transcriptional regulator